MVFDHKHYLLRCDLETESRYQNERAQQEGMILTVSCLIVRGTSIETPESGQ